MKNNRFISALNRFMDGEVSFEPKANPTLNPAKALDLDKVCTTNKFS